MKHLKAAIAGLGFMGVTHAEALRRLGIEIVGIIGIDVEEGRNAIDKFGVDRIYEDFDQLVHDPDVDVVHICTPNYLHYPMSKSALLAEKHVICEKPLANTQEEARELKQIAETCQCVAAVNYNLRFYPLCQEAHAKVNNGELGNINIIHGQYCQDWLFLPTDWNWRLEQKLGGDLRAVSDIGTHWADMVTWITNSSITGVMADLATIVSPRIKPTREVETFASKLTTQVEGESIDIHTEDYGAILLTFSNGARGILMVSQVSAGRKNHFWWEVNGSKASLWWDQESPNQLWVGHRERPNEYIIKDPALMDQDIRIYASFPGGHAEGYPDTFMQMFKTVYTYITNGDSTVEPTYPTFKDGWREMVLCEAIQRSAKEKRWINIQYD